MTTIADSWQQIAEDRAAEIARLKEEHKRYKDETFARFDRVVAVLDKIVDTVEELVKEEKQNRDTRSVLIDAIVTTDRFFATTMKNLNVKDSALTAENIATWNEAEIAVTRAMDALRNEVGQ